MNDEEKSRLAAIEALIEIEVDRALGEPCIWDCEIMQNDIRELEKTAFGDLNKPSEETRRFDYAKFAAYKRDHCCGLTQDEAKEWHGRSFDVEMWQAATRAADSERAKYSTPGPKKTDLELDRE